MSVHTIPRRHSPDAYDVRWRSHAGQWSRRFEVLAEATAFDEAMKARLAKAKADAAWAKVPKRWQQAADAELAAMG